MNETRPRVHLMSGLLGGGAANAAKRLLSGLHGEGIDAHLYYPAKLKGVAKNSGTGGNGAQRTGIDPLTWDVRGFERLKQGISYRIHRQDFKRKVRDRPAGMEIFTSPRGAPYTPWPPVGFESQPGDILHLHWIAKFVDYQSFFTSLPLDMPVVWTLHDMNPFTGGCHFNEGCRHFTSGCGNCPQLPEPSPKDISQQFFDIKREALRNVNLHVVTVSRWMMEQAKQSSIFERVRSFHHIPYGLPLTEFQPVDRAEARAELGLDSNAFVFAFGAADIQNRRKGVRLLLEALQSIADIPNAVGLVFGGGDLPEVTQPIPPIRSMGFVKEVKRMMLIYSACDVFVLPSTEDNLPLTCVESLASGTPVVAFDAGGIPDMVRPNQTGLLAPNGDAVALGEQLRYIAEHPNEAAEMGKTARKIALAEYSGEREAKDYAQLYATLLAEKSAVD